MKYNTESFIEKAKKVHGDRFDYSLTEFITTNHKVKIICPKHGRYKQVAAKHLMGNNCPKCFHDNKSNNILFRR